ncbi:hypothetical protein SLEP1_g49746 [Rubroshorea leprosula]|uniref:Gnk2-homologous domain-containing protein n=1 Tax=Rubroshorea leprosula TaxID=152421 RepID=A0AAV5LXS9_9ROSI|nr:hypothetical protein SLEP1_g49746 [Rubroshorea leprosula]
MMVKPTNPRTDIHYSFSSLPPQTRVDIEYEDDWSECIESCSIHNFDANLDNLLNQLAASGPNSGFYKTTAGEKSDKIYGLVQCRGDVSTANCASCTSKSIAVALQDFPESKTVKVWFTSCYLRVQLHEQACSCCSKLDADISGWSAGDSGNSYRMVQCARDIIRANCSKCLDAQLMIFKTIVGKYSVDGSFQPMKVHPIFLPSYGQRLHL